MTTFQDQPPQSRRAARESERAAQASGTGVDYNAFLEPTESDAARERQETARPASAGRRAQRPEGGAAADLPVDTAPPAPTPAPFASQIPSYDGPSFARTTPRPPSDTDQPYRVRDYSPEGGRRRASLPQAAAPADLEYRTAATPDAWQPPTAEPATAEPTPAEVAPVASTPQPMTRREARALFAQQEAEAAAAAALVEPPAATSSATALSNAIAEFEALTRAAPAETTPAETAVDEPALDETVQDEPVAETVAADEPVATTVIPVPLVEPLSPSDSDWHTIEQPAEDTVTASVEPASEPEPEIVLDEFDSEIVDAAEPAPFPFALQPSSRTQESIPLVESVPVAAVIEPETEPEIELAVSPAEPELFAEPQPAAVVETVATTEPEFIEPPVVRESYTPPTGHWSRQADLDDDLPFESTLSREVGASNLSTTTSALILPSIPQSDFSGILNGTGEILITGTIELPESLGTMGGDSRNFDHPDVDHMFDAFDKELVSNDSQPVRAIRAVSTHTATRNMIQANTKTHSNRLLTVAIVAVSIVALATVGLLAVYIISTMNS